MLKSVKGTENSQYSKNLLSGHFPLWSVLNTGKFLIQYEFFRKYVNPLTTNPTKWSNTLKQFVNNLPTNCFSVFDHFVGLALKGLTSSTGDNLSGKKPPLWGRQFFDFYGFWYPSSGSYLYAPATDTFTETISQQTHYVDLTLLR